MTPNDYLQQGATPQELRDLLSQMVELPTHGIVSYCPAILNAIKMCYSISSRTTSDHSVLLLGKSGTGKELFARLFEKHGLPMLPLNCAALPDTLIQAMLFGYEKGAFTGANEAKEGIFVAAKSGVVFLDEIGDMPLAQQTNLLRIIENRTVMPLGGTRIHNVNCRIIAATNVDVHDSTRLRQDLLGRFTFVIDITPVEERGEADIQALAKLYGLSQAGLELCRHEIPTFGVRAIKRAAALEKLAR